MSVRGARPGEIYEDKNGYRWLVTSTCDEPTVHMQQIVPIWGEDQPRPPSQGGGVTGGMWNGFKKIADAAEPRQ